MFVYFLTMKVILFMETAIFIMLKVSRTVVSMVFPIFKVKLGTICIHNSRKSVGSMKSVVSYIPVFSFW